MTEQPGRFRQIKKLLRAIGWWLADGALARWPASTRQDDARELSARLARIEATVQALQDRPVSAPGVERHLADIIGRIEVLTDIIIADSDERRACEGVRVLGPTFLGKHSARMYSQNYEESVVTEIFKRIGTKDRTFIEVGVGDGLQNTTRFLLQMGWRGLWIEANPADCAKIRSRFSTEIQSGDLQLVEALVTTENIQGLIDQAGIAPEVDYMSVDIDQNTSHAWKAISTKARACCVEYNASVPPSVDLEVPYDASANWDLTNYFGASLKALERIGRDKRMSLVGCDTAGVNAYFVAAELADGKFVGPFDAETHFQPARYYNRRRGHRPSP
ncbi:hypothetical protein ACFQU1_22410 [Chelatococcus sp. GCM10030263]|uniref:hypothetical protein n=1 Tax=Chelatococcus sp. GCM10030263 TaxID=3273387 RepID=UPI0036185439